MWGCGCGGGKVFDVAEEELLVVVAAVENNEGE